MRYSRRIISKIYFCIFLDFRTLIPDTENDEIQEGPTRDTGIKVFSHVDR